MTHYIMFEIRRYYSSIPPSTQTTATSGENYTGENFSQIRTFSFAIRLNTKIIQQLNEVLEEKKVSQSKT